MTDHEGLPPELLAQLSKRGRGRKVLRATGWAMLDARGRIIVNSIRDKAEATRLAAGEGKVYPVTIFLEREDD
jgi:hypothetical protein